MQLLLPCVQLMKNGNDSNMLVGIFQRNKLMHKCQDVQLSYFHYGRLVSTCLLKNKTVKTQQKLLWSKDWIRGGGLGNTSMLTSLSISRNMVMDMLSLGDLGKNLSQCGAQLDQTGERLWKWVLFMFKVHFFPTF